MRGYCELCGYHASALDRLRGRGLAPTVDGSLLVCPACRRDDPPDRSLAAISALPMVVAIALLILLAVVAGPALLEPPDIGDDPGAVGVDAPSGAGRASVDPRAEPPGPAPGAAAGSTSTPSGRETEVRLEPGKAAVQLWSGPYGEVRLQVIVPVRNRSEGWVRLRHLESTYRVVDRDGREVASGIFAAALPTRIGPGETTFLVDTVSATFVEPESGVTAHVVVRAVEADSASWRLKVMELRFQPTDGGSMRISGVVRNDGPSTVSWVVPGAVVLDPAGTPIAALYDPTDVGRLAPGETRPFDTRYPGAPPVAPERVGRLVGVAFEAEP